MAHSPKDEVDWGEWLLRGLAFLGIVALPGAWLFSLAGSPELFRTNAVRVAAAVVGGFLAWHRARNGGPGRPSWRSCLVGGVAGSLVASALSLVFPALGRVWASGWLMSGVVGGAMVALGLRGVLGGLRSS